MKVEEEKTGGEQRREEKRRRERKGERRGVFPHFLVYSFNTCLIVCVSARVR